jgi:uncharacterized phage protein (TIGR01671 family)
MREIKFRAWDMQCKKMSKVNMILFNTNEIDIDENFGEPKSIEHFELMQYTGLKDKNGVDIYEGDILQFETGGIIKTTIVSFERGSFVVKNSQGKFLTESVDHILELNEEVYLEIIGNIHENKELCTILK